MLGFERLAPGPSSSMAVFYFYFYLSINLFLTLSMNSAMSVAQQFSPTAPEPNVNYVFEWNSNASWGEPSI